MARYRRKPLVVEAVRWNGKLADETEWPDWFREALGTKIQAAPGTEHPQLSLVLSDSAGYVARINPGDYIIKDFHTIYPLDAATFERAYERADVAIVP